MREQKPEDWSWDDRVAVLERQGAACFYCGRPVTINPARENTATFDHFIPHSQGGRDDRSNRVAACQSCDALKADRMPTRVERDKFTTMIDSASPPEEGG